MRRAIRWTCALWLALAWLPARADGVLFYQPLNVDAGMDAGTWKAMLDQARAAGTRTLIVQWTRHADSDFGGAEGWLLQRLREAQADGLQLVLGLSYDPAYYRTMADARAVTMAWYQWLADAQRQHRWLREHGRLAPVGWYLPLELDDRLFADPALRSTLARQLEQFRAQLDAPLHLSAFSAGVLTPRQYASWLDQLPVDQVWWQDGRGTRALAPEVLDAYRGALSCRIGIVNEAFEQISQNTQDFSARPRPPADDAGCHPRAVFSLRYRPWGAPLLERLRSGGR